MNLSAINGNNNNSQVAFGTRITGNALDLVVQDAKNRGKLSELSEIIPKIKDLGTCDTTIDYHKGLKSLYITHPSLNKAILLKGDSIAEQAIGINANVIANAENELAKGIGIDLYV